MDLDFTLVVIAVFVIVMLIMFARFSITYHPPSDSKPKPTIKRPLLNSRNNAIKSNNTYNILKNNDKKPQYSAFGLPPKDSYMSRELKNQIDTLRTKFYYDNCQYRLLEDFTDNKPNKQSCHPYINVSMLNTNN